MNTESRIAHVGVSVGNYRMSTWHIMGVSAEHVCACASVSALFLCLCDLFWDLPDEHVAYFGSFG